MKTLYNYIALFVIVGMLVASMGMKKQVRPGHGAGMAADRGEKNVVSRVGR